MNPVELGWKVLNISGGPCSGAPWIAYRLKYLAQHKLGLLKRGLPHKSWEEQPVSAWLSAGVPSSCQGYAEWRGKNGARFFFASVDELRPPLTRFSSAVPAAEKLLAGELRMFSGQALQVGFPPDWHKNPITQQRTGADEHWSELSFFGAGGIKFIWEANRFSHAFTLARAYAVSRDERYADAFWLLVEDWMEKNPPQWGANWKCGQETSFRIMALCFGFFAFQKSQRTTADRIARFATLMAVQAERVAFHIDYARSQKNNHAISEGMGLWTVGVLFPEFKQSAKWRELGRRVLEEEAERQIYADGGYVQHSFVYQRMVLDIYVWCLRLGELNQQALSPQIKERVRKSAEFLFQMGESSNGHVPNYGANDGSNILPLTNCDYPDFRPALQRASFYCNGAHLFPSGEWDEGLVWLFGEAAITGVTVADSVIPVSSEFKESGYFTLRGSGTWGMSRCADYKDRPGQADQLHLDLWWKGKNIACDPGTFLYDGAEHEDWNKGLSATAVHNTVMVDGRDQMLRAGRFLWLDWARGKSAKVRRSENRSLEYWQGEHDGYRKLGIIHRRGVLRIGEIAWVIVDTLLGSGSHAADLQWLLPAGAFEFVGENELRLQDSDFSLHFWCSIQSQVNMVRAGERVAGKNGHGSPLDKLRGWSSMTYGEKQPALSLGLHAQGPFPLRMITVFQLGNSSEISFESGNISGKDFKINLNVMGAETLMRDCTLKGGESL